MDVFNRMRFYIHAHRVLASVQIVSSERSMLECTERAGAGERCFWTADRVRDQKGLHQSDNMFRASSMAKRTVNTSSKRSNISCHMYVTHALKRTHDVFSHVKTVTCMHSHVLSHLCALTRTHDVLSHACTYTHQLHPYRETKKSTDANERPSLNSEGGTPALNNHP